jgi:hypothetical protein
MVLIQFMKVLLGKRLVTIGAAVCKEVAIHWWVIDDCYEYWDFYPHYITYADLYCLQLLLIILDSTFIGLDHLRIIE